MDISKILLNDILNDISTFNNKNLEKIIFKLPISELKPSSFNELSYLLLSTSFSCLNQQSIYIIIDFFSSIYNMDMNYISTLFLIDYYEPKLLKYIIQQYPTISFIEIIDDLSTYAQSPELQTALIKLVETFGEQTTTTYQMIISAYSLPVVIPMIVEFAKDRLRRISEYADKPIYINTQEPFLDQLPNENDIKLLTNKYKKYNINKVKLPEFKYALEMAFKNELLILDDQSTTEEKYINEMDKKTNELNKKEIVEQIVLLDQFMKNRDDEKLYRLLGPSNPFLNGDIYGIAYGGSRMFLHREVDDDDVPIEWFKGYCYVCDKRIKYYHHAVRKPIFAGGWSGCYCSFECVRQDITQDDIGVYKLCKFHEDDIKKIGIQDRICKNVISDVLTPNMRKEFINIIKKIEPKFLDGVDVKGLEKNDKQDELNNKDTNFMNSKDLISMRLSEYYFYAVGDGTKKYEVRLLDDKRQKIKLNDVIQFTNRENENMTTNVRIIEIKYYKKFKDCIEDTNLPQLLPQLDNDENGVKNAVELYKSIYNDDKIVKKWGIVRFKFELL